MMQPYISLLLTLRPDLTWKHVSTFRSPRLLPPCAAYCSDRKAKATIYYADDDKQSEWKLFHRIYLQCIYVYLDDTVWISECVLTCRNPGRWTIQPHASISGVSFPVFTVHQRHRWHCNDRVRHAYACMHCALKGHTVYCALERAFHF